VKSLPARLSLLIVWLWTDAAFAQTLPAGPMTALDGRLTVGAEIVGTIGDEDDVAFFNYTDYEHNALRSFRAALTGMWRPLERVAFIADVRTDNLEDVRAYAAYVRVRPLRDQALDIQAGRIPPVFGSFARQAYSLDNPVIGYPLAYQYLTSLRADAIPANSSELASMRARGWRAEYSIGSPEPGPGIPVVSSFRWDTGIQVRWRHRMVEVAGALTNGTLGDPQVGDNNGGKQISGRVAVLPMPGLVIGGSAARGAWLDRDLQGELDGLEDDASQTAIGADFEYSRDYWVIRGELVWSRWQMPFAATGRVQDLDALATWIEGRYRFTPRVFVGARVDRLGFSDIRTDRSLVAWDAPVTRVETALGYYLQRNLILRAAVQYNDRDAGRVTRRTYFAGQIACWF
jgi:hypothetical protein